MEKFNTEIEYLMNISKHESNLSELICNWNLTIEDDELIKYKFFTSKLLMWILKKYKII